MRGSSDSHRGGWLEITLRQVEIYCCRLKVYRALNRWQGGRKKGTGNRGQKRKTAEFSGLFPVSCHLFPVIVFMPPIPVETKGLEPSTPALQRLCSPN